MSTPEFGFTRAGAMLVRLAEPIGTTTPNALAPRARSIARGNGVHLTCDGRQVSARIHRGGAASVAHLEFTPLPPGTAAALRDALGGRSEPDDAVFATLTAAGTPVTAALDAVDCSCRARTARCVHVLAALYALASHVDHDPAAVLGIVGYHEPGAPPDGSGDGPPPRWVPLTALDPRGYWG